MFGILWSVTADHKHEMNFTVMPCVYYNTGVYNKLSFRATAKDPYLWTFVTQYKKNVWRFKTW